MEDRERIYPAAAADVFARERLSAKRYGHALRVANTAEELARAHGLVPGRSRLAALLHDAARETSSEEFLDLADDLGLSVGEPERESPKLLHGPVAAELARRELGVEDEGVLEAIRDHTTGRPGMGPLSLVRNYPSVKNLRLLARHDLRAAAAESLRRSIAHNEERGRPTHPASIEALGWLEEAEEGT